MTSLALLLAAALLSGDQTAPDPAIVLAPEVAPVTVTAPPAADAAPRRTCVTSRSTSSRLATTRLCRTTAEWNDRDQRLRRDLDRATNNGQGNFNRPILMQGGQGNGR